MNPPNKTFIVKKDGTPVEKYEYQTTNAIISIPESCEIEGVKPSELADISTDKSVLTDAERLQL
jgi:hypothetical protein